MIADDDIKQISALLYEHANVIGNSLESVATAIDELTKVVRDQDNASVLSDIEIALDGVAKEIKEYT